MSILVDADTRLVVQGLGKTGRFHADRSIAYGTRVVAAVHPSRAGESELFEGDIDDSGVPDQAGGFGSNSQYSGR